MSRTRRVAVGLAALFAVASRARAEEPPLSAAHVNGVYVSDDNEIDIAMLGPRKLRVAISLTNNYRGAEGAMSAEGAASGEASLKGDSATFVDSAQPSCKILLKFLPKKQLEVPAGASQPRKCRCPRRRIRWSRRARSMPRCSP